MPRYTFHLQVADGQLDQLRRLNSQYGDALSRAAKEIPGLHGIAKYVLGSHYIEQVDYDGDFSDFSRQLTADKEVRQFLRSVDECFVESLRDMPDQEMACLQTLP